MLFVVIFVNLHFHRAYGTCKYVKCPFKLSFHILIAHYNNAGCLLLGKKATSLCYSCNVYAVIGCKQIRCIPRYTVQLLPFSILISPISFQGPHGGIMIPFGKLCLTSVCHTGLFMEGLFIISSSKTTVYKKACIQLSVGAVVRHRSGYLWGNFKKNKEY